MTILRYIRIVDKVEFTKIFSSGLKNPKIEIPFYSKFIYFGFNFFFFSIIIAFFYMYIRVISREDIDDLSFTSISQ